MKAEIEKFFTEYEERFNRAIHSEDINAKEAASSFAECFVESSPRGVICGKNDDEFLKMIPKGYEHYRNIGTTSMKILSLHIQELDEIHYLAKVHWDSYYRKNENDIQIDFVVIYFLRIQDEIPKIFAYISGDEEKVLKDKGLLQ